jgi:hypothetical protein
VTLTAETGVGTAALDNGHLAFDNSHTDGGEYTLDIRLVSTGGKQWFVHAGVIISATDTHYVAYGAWDGLGTLTLEIDHGSDGTIDESVALENQVRHIHLPLVLRNT